MKYKKTCKSSFQNDTLTKGTEMLDNNMKSFHENKDKSMEKDQTYDANIGENHCKYQGPGP